MRESDRLNLERLYREIKETDPEKRDRERRKARRMVREVAAVEKARLKQHPREAGAPWYDYRYQYSKKRLEYIRKPSNSVYIAVWKAALRWIRDEHRIADFGCGVGQFAQLAIESGKVYTLGVDFSKVAISMARKSNPKHADCFRVADLYDKVTYTLAAFDVTVLLETLEHVEKDLFVLQQVPVGKSVVLSVPNFLSYGHCRWFKTLEDAVSRYHFLLKISQTRCFELSEGVKIWLICGVRCED